MLNRVYRLVSPHQFEPVETQIDLTRAEVVVRPTFLSICNADQRYFQGQRPAGVLARKLPMALIHEGIGVVRIDNTGTYQPGQRVVMLPNAPTAADKVIAENYLTTSRFCGSGFDGFMQEYVELPVKRVLPLPGYLDDSVASFTEIVSVAMHAVSRFESISHARRDTLGVWGDGNLGFLVALSLRAVFPKAHIVVVGRNSYKLDEFTFVDDVRLSYDIPASLHVDHAFECCGGEGSADAIDQIIDVIEPEGAVGLLGVTENRVPVNTRMVLEKGLRLFGNSRSGRVDFQRVLELYETNPRMVQYLSSLVGQEIRVASTNEMAEAFDSDKRKPMGKTVLEWAV